MKRTFLLLAVCLLLYILAGCSLSSDPEPASVEEAPQLSTDASSIDYAARTQTISVKGTGNYAALLFPEEVKSARVLEVQDDEFELSAYLVMLREEGLDEQKELPGLIDRTEKSLRFLRQYLLENSGAAYPSSRAELPVVIKIDKTFGYQTEEEQIALQYSDVGTHREFLYLLALMDSDAAGWEQLGYAWYVGTCIDSYTEVIDKWPLVPTLPYYPQCIAGGVDPENVAASDFRTIYDACARVCFEKGLTHWGSFCESMPVTSEAVFTRTKNKEPGDTLLTAFTAASFLAWLDESSGFEQLSLFCFGQQTFEESFGTDFHTAYEEWRSWIIQTYPAS